MAYKTNSTNQKSKNSIIILYLQHFLCFLVVVSRQVYVALITSNLLRLWQIQ